MRFRHIRTKLTLITVPILIFSAIALYFSSNLSILPGFQKIENDLAIKNANRAVDSINSSLVDLDQKASDWSNWDDTYSFVRDHNQKYIISNLASDTLVNLKLDYMLFYNASNQLVDVRHIDPYATDPVALPIQPGIKALLSPSSPLLKHSDITDAHKGLAVVPEGILALVSRPILTSLGEGPSRGSLVFARYIDGPVQQSLSKLTQLKLAYLPSTNPAITGSKPSYPSKTSKGSQWVSLVSDTTAQAFATIPDIFGHPSITAKVELGRQISQQGHASLRTFFLVALSAGAAIILAIVLLLNWVVVARILGLSKQLQALDDIEDESSMVVVAGDDELAALGTSINDLLARLRTTNDLKKANTSLEKKAQERAKELSEQLEQMKRLNSLMVDRELRMTELKKQNADLKARISDQST